MFLLAADGLSYTPDQVRAMTARDRDALLSIAVERAEARRKERAKAEAEARRHRR